MRRDRLTALVLALSAALQAPRGASAQDSRTPPAGAARRPAAPAKAKTQARPAAPDPDPDGSRMKALLRDWETHSSELKTLDVRIKRLDKSGAWGDEEYEGRAILKSPNLAWLDFKKVETDDAGKRTTTPYERIVCTGTEAWQYRSDLKQIFVFPLDRRDQKRMLEEEGPLPFLFNMRAADAEKRYRMKLVKEEPRAWIISILPQLKVDQEGFSRAFLQLNKSTFFPDRIMLVSPDGKSTKEFLLSDVQRNKEVSPENFKGKVLAKPWTVVRDPAGGGGPPAAAGAGARALGADVRTRGRGAGAPAPRR